MNSSEAYVREAEAYERLAATCLVDLNRASLLQRAALWRKLAAATATPESGTTPVAHRQ
jgi:hypothetical protein